MSAHAPSHAPSAAPSGHPGGHAVVDGSLLGLLRGIQASVADVAHAVEHTAHEEHEKHQAHEKAHAAAAAKAAAAAPAASGEAAKPAAGGHGHDHGGHGNGEKSADLWNLMTRQVPHVYKEWKRGNLDEKEIGDLLDAAMDWAGVNWARPFVDPLSWGLKKLLGAHEHVHEVEPDYANLGTQILGWPEDKNGGFHHSYEGFVVGMKERKDVNALNRQFRHFADKTLFDKAMKEDKVALRKLIANLLGIEGEVSRKELEAYMGLIITRLGGHLGGTPGHFHIHPHHALRASLDPKHRAVLKIYENAYNWLTEAALSTINSDAPEEKPFKIDFEHFGDFLLEEVNPKNRDRYLKGIDSATFLGTFKTKFLYLTHEDDLKAALKKPELRDIVIEQLHQFTGVKRPMTQKTLEDHVKVFLERMGAKPVAPAALVAEYQAFEDALNLVVKTLGDSNALKELFEDKEAKKPIDYNKIGEEVMARTKTPAALKAFEVQFEPGEMLIPYGVLLDERDLLAEAKSNPDRLMATLGKFYGLIGTLTDDRLARRATELRTRLTQLPDTEVPEAHQLADNIAAITQRIVDNNILAPKWNYAKLGEQVFARVQSYKDLEAAEKTLHSPSIEKQYGVLFDRDLLLAQIEADPEQVKAKIAQLLDIDTTVTLAAVRKQSRAMEALLMQNPSSGARASLPQVDALLRNIQQLESFLTVGNTSTLDQKSLDKLFGKKAPDVTPSSVEDFIGTFRDLEDETQVAAMVRGYRSSAFRARLNYMVDSADFADALKPESASERAEAIEQVRLFVGQNTGTVRTAYLEQVVKEFEDKLTTLNKASLSPEDQVRYDAMAKDFADIKATLGGDNLKKLFEQKDAAAEAPFALIYRQFGNEVFTRTSTENDQKRFLLGFKVDRFEASQTAFYPLARIPGKLKNPKERARLKEAIDALFYPAGTAPFKVEKSDLDQQIRLMGLALGEGNVEKTKYDELMAQLNEVATALDGSLAELYADEPEVMDVKPGNIGTLLKTELTNKETAIAFLRGYRPAYIRDQFNVLADAKAFDTSHAGADRREVAQMQTMLRAFVGLEIGRITPDYLDATVTTFTENLELAEPNTLPTELKAKHTAFLKLAEDITANLKANERLEKLFNPDAVTIDYDNFGAGVQKLEGAQTLNFLRQLNTGILGTKLMKFKLEMTLDNVKTPAEREELRVALAKFLGAPQDAILTRNDIIKLGSQMLSRFGEPRSLQMADREAYSNWVALGNLTDRVIDNLKEERLTNLYKGTKTKRKAS